jgi:hypothetical protein
LNFLEQFWDNFYNHDFFREVVTIPMNGYTQRWEVPEINRFSEFFWQYNGQANIYAGIYSHQQREAKEFDRLYADFDSINLDLAFNHATALAASSVSKYGGSPLFISSGNKGANVYTFFEPVILKHFSYVTRRFFEEWKNELRLGSLDLSVVGQDNRVSRIPYSINLKGKRRCEPLDPNHERSPTLGGILVEMDKEAEEQLKDRDETFDKHIDISEGDIQHLMNIMANLPNKPGSGWNRAMYCMLAPMIAQKYKWEDAVSIMEQFLRQTDSLGDKNYAINQMRSAYRKNINPMRMDTFLYNHPDLYKYFANR